MFNWILRESPGYRDSSHLTVIVDLDIQGSLNIRTPFAQTPVIIFFPMEINSKPEVATGASESAGTNLLNF